MTPNSKVVTPVDREVAADGMTSLLRQRRPIKRLFALTDAGRRALHEFIERPPMPTAIRDELLVQVEATDLGDASTVRSHVHVKLGSAERNRGLHGFT